jgi:hypothetical protein
MTLKSGLARLAGPGLGVLCADLDGDGWQDILVANDAQANRLWLNRRDFTFVESAGAVGLAYIATGQSQGNMGIAFGDVDGNGLADIFITHLTEETHTLWRQESPGRFREATADARVAATGWRGTGFGAVLADFNADGWLDLVWVNGRVARRNHPPLPRPVSFLAPYEERHQLLMNEGSGRFRDISISNPTISGAPGVGRALAVGDINGDGAPDLLVTQVGGPARILLNQAPNRGHWLTVRAIDPKLKRDAYGAVITLRAEGRSHVRHVLAAFSYQCSNDPRVHFGLGGAERFESIHVRWPDGHEESFPGGAANRPMILNKGDGKP